MKTASQLFILSTLFMMNCIGTDEVEDTVNAVTIIPPEDVTIVNGNTFAKVLGQEALLEAEAKSDLGGTFMVADNLTWESENPGIATVSLDGLVQAVGLGTTVIRVTFLPSNSGPVSNEVMVSVAGDTEAIALIEITSEDNLLVIEPGAQLRLSGTPLNAAGSEVPTTEPLVWRSSNDSIASVTADGLVSGLTPGEVIISASLEDASGLITLFVDNPEEEMSALTRTAEFEGLAGYNAEGDASLTTNTDGSLVLRLASNFQTSNGPGLYLYLSNSPNQVGGGVEIGPLESTSGEQEYDVPNQVSLTQFQHIVLYCKPFGVGFGTAELSN